MNWWYDSVAIDYCAGIGGWEVALHKRNMRGAGIENAPWPRLTRLANHLDTIHDDLTTLPRSLMKVQWAGAVGSFPCTTFSQNIKGKTWEQIMADPRSQLTQAGLAHLLKMTPRFVCLENVAKAQPVMAAVGQALAAKHGYSWDLRVLNAADYGLPQARKRAILVARRDGEPIVWREPTHIDPRTVEDPEQWDWTGPEPWVSMGQALGRTFEGEQAWGNTLPAPAVVGSFDAHMHAPPRYRGFGDVSRQNDPGAINCTLEERLLLQGFPAGWRLTGPVSAQDLQVGNAIPPILADVALEAAGVPA